MLMKISKMIAVFTFRNRITFQKFHKLSFHLTQSFLLFQITRPIYHNFMSLKLFFWSEMLLFYALPLTKIKSYTHKSGIRQNTIIKYVHIITIKSIADKGILFKRLNKIAKQLYIFDQWMEIKKNSFQFQKESIPSLSSIAKMCLLSCSQTTCL